MTTPANRAPKASLFGAPVVFEDDTGSWVPGYVAGHPSTGRILVRSYDGREDRVLLVSDDDVTWRRADGTIPFEPTTPADDPIGPALPAKVAAKSLGQVACNAGSKGMYVDWDAAAAAVIAAHEARKGWEVTEKFAAHCSDDDTWWSQARGWAAKVHRTEYDTPGECPSLRSLDGCKIFRITRRRRVVKS